jgi:uncharacterized protein YcaQ
MRRIQEIQTASTSSYSISGIGSAGKPVRAQGSRVGGVSGNGKAKLEHPYDPGLVAIADRRGFERLYYTTEGVIPQAALAAAPPPKEQEAVDLSRSEGLRRRDSTAKRLAGLLKHYRRRGAWVSRSQARFAEGQRRGWICPRQYLPFAAKG